MSLLAREGLDTIRKNWFCYLILGGFLIILGMVALIYTVAATVAAVLFFGWLLVFSGLMQAALSFQARSWGGFFLHFMGGVLELIVGLFVIDEPGAAALGATVLLAVYLMIGGLFRAGSAFSLGFPGWPWIAVGGIVSFLLGLMIWRQWPLSALWVPGVCVGVDLILHGGAWLAFALAARNLPEPPQPATAA